LTKIKILNGIFLRLFEVPTSKRDIWFVHGYGGCGRIFQEAFSSALLPANNLYAPDIPGFGASPPVDRLMGIRNAASLLGDLIDTVSAGCPIVIVTHSLGKIIGIWLCERFRNKVAAYIDVEGNLTEANAYFCCLANKYATAEELRRALVAKIFAMLKDSRGAINRHYASIQLADPKSLSIKGRSGASATGKEKSGREFTSLACRKRYFWVDVSTPQGTKDFIERIRLPNRRFAGVGH
jgi:pimeloyl-ACP methyl ester carboxylesterase